MEFEKQDVGGGYAFAYKTNSDGSVGVNYYFNGQPIPNAQFAQATGADVGKLEANAYNAMANARQVAGPVPNSYLNQTMPEGSNANDIYNNPLAIGDAAKTPTSPTGGGPAAAPYVPEIVTFMGKNYDLNNPDDRNAYIEVQSGEIDKELTKALQTGNLTYAAKLAEQQDQMTQYNRDWQAQGKDLLGGYNQGQSARQQAYQGMGTRAYQSSMGTSGQYALNQLGEAQNERMYQKGIAEKQNKNAITGLETAYNDWISGAQSSAQANKDSLSTNVANIGGFDTSKLGKTLSSQADLAPYTPYTNFQSLSSSPMVGAAKTISQAPVSQMTLSQWLQANSNKSGNQLQLYLQGKA